MDIFRGSRPPPDSPREGSEIRHRLPRGGRSGVVPTLNGERGWDLAVGDELKRTEQGRQILTDTLAQLQRQTRKPLCPLLPAPPPTPASSGRKRKAVGTALPVLTSTTADISSKRQAECTSSHRLAVPAGNGRRLEAQPTKRSGTTQVATQSLPEHSELWGDRYFEKQQRGECGRHALNNVFGTSVFSHEDMQAAAQQVFAELNSQQEADEHINHESGWYSHGVLAMVVQNVQELNARLRTRPVESTEYRSTHS